MTYMPYLRSIPAPSAQSAQVRPPQRRRRQGWRAVTSSVLIAFALLGATVGLWQHFTPAEAGCPTYTIRWGDTLNRIASQYHTSIYTLAKLNHLQDVNRIFAGQQLCVGSGNSTNVVVQHQLQWSTRGQVYQVLLNAADQHGLPHSLVLAIAWQESGWTQHVIAWDGGIGTMQIMPYTAVWLNNYFGTHYDAYRLNDNIELGTRYLRLLWNSFGGDLPRIISAYNEGEHNVRTRGIFNWRYVTSVSALIHRFS